MVWKMMCSMCSLKIEIKMCLAFQKMKGQARKSEGGDTTTTPFQPPITC